MMYPTLPPKGSPAAVAHGRHPCVRFSGQRALQSLRAPLLATCAPRGLPLHSAEQFASAVLLVLA